MVMGSMIGSGISIVLADVARQVQSPSLLILAGARIYYAMARDGLFFRIAERVHPKYQAPVHSLILQGVWASALALSGTYSQLLDYVIFAVWCSTS